MNKSILYFVLLLLFSCNQYKKYPHYNDNSSTIRVILEGPILDVLNQDSTLVHFNFFTLSNGTSTKLPNKIIKDINLSINGVKIVSDSLILSKIKFRSGKKELSITYKNENLSSLNKKKIIFQANTELSIYVFLIDDNSAATFKRTHSSYIL